MQAPTGQHGAPWDQGPRLLTPLTGALLLLTIYVVAAYAAYQALMAFPTPRAFWSLALLAPLAAAAGAWVGAIARHETRMRAALFAGALAIGVPFGMVAWIPGIAQPQQDRLPGGTDVVIAAAPDGNLDLYLSPDGDPDRTILTADHDGYDEPLLWAPEDDILFLSDRAGIGGVFGYLMEPDGSDVRLFLRL